MPPLALAGMFLAFAGGASAQESSLDRILRMASAHDAWLDAPPAPTERAPRPSLPQPLPGRLLPALPPAAALERADPLAAPVVRALVALEPGGEIELERLGAGIGARAGEVVTARIPLAALADAAAHPAVRFIEAAVWLTPSELVAPVRAPVRAETAANDAGFGRLRQRVGDRFLGLAGQGVIIGVFDTGLDLAHPDFRDAEGRSRVLFAWDQSVPGQPPGAVGEHEFAYGDECDNLRVDSGACPMVDRSGHGTHVAGIAAGTGAATGAGRPPYRFVGTAPAADLIIVKGGDESFTSDALVDGVAYIFARAAELGRPAVVNLSLGTQSGPHDGTTLLERALDALTGPGRIIVTVAGNHGTNENETPAFQRAPIHAMGIATPGASNEHFLVVPGYPPRPGAVNDGAFLELWYDGADSLAVTVVTPRGDSLRVVTGDTATVTTAGGAIYVDNGFGGPQAINGDHAALIAIFDADEAAPPDTGRWAIRVHGTAGHGSGAYHLWLIGSTFENPVRIAALEGGTRNSHVISSPGTGDRMITAAAHVTRHEWRGLAGPEQFPFREPLGDIAFFSSPGPRRDGRLKPDLSAPGKVVIAAMGRDATQWRSLEWLVEESGTHAGLLGSSMAAPHVAGAVALLLQLEPDLTPDAARELLTGAARQDAFTGRAYTGESDGSPNAQWGHGKLDVEAAVWRLGRPPGRLLVDAAPVAPAPGPSSIRGTRLDLLTLAFDADTLEAVAVESILLELVGQDPAAALVLRADDDLTPPGGEEVDRVPIGLAGGAQPFELRPELVIPAGMVRRFTLSLELSGYVPNAATFRARLDPAGLRTRGTVSGAADLHAGLLAPIASSPQTTSLLEAGETLNLSANPVRGDQLIINYRERPRAVSIYGIDGRRIRLLAGSALEDGRAVWDLANDAGNSVANGVYLLVVDGAAGPITRRVLVVR